MRVDGRLSLVVRSLADYLNGGSTDERAND